MAMPPLWKRYSLSFLTPLIALGLTLLAVPLMDSVTLLLFLVAVMVSTWYGGRGPGILAITTGAGLIAFFILPPIYSFGIEASGNIVRFAVYLLSSAVVAWLAATRREALHQFEEGNKRLRQEITERQRADQALSELNMQLERRIAERTAQLQKANDALRQSQQDLERRVQQRTEELASANGALAEANAKLVEKIHDLEVFHDVVVGRELKMVDIRKENESLRQENESLRRPANGPRQPDQGLGQR